jgi:hypothetical protein
MTLIEIRLLAVAGMVGVMILTALVIAGAARLAQWATSAHTTLKARASGGAHPTRPRRNAGVETTTHALQARQAMWRLRC